jgi:hypothetical protein
MSTHSKIRQSRKKISWHYLQAVQGEIVRKASRAVVPAIFAVGGLFAGCIGMYFALSISWTHFFFRADQVAPNDIDLVLAISIIAGVIAGAVALKLSARLCRFPQTRSLRSDLDRRSKRPVLTL